MNFFLTGENISHSLSPFIYNYLFKYYNIDAKYEIIENTIATFPNFILNYKTRGYKGGNITMPFKNMARYLVDTEYEGESINLVYNNKGYNTDYEGIKNHFKIENKKILILGYGGAGMAIAKALSHKNKVYIKNRKVNEDIGNNEIIINTTCCTMHGFDSEKILKNLDFSKTELVMDIVYNPVETLLIKKAKDVNIKTLDGLNLLVWQAVESFKIFCNIDASDKIEILYNMLKKICR